MKSKVGSKIEKRTKRNREDATALGRERSIRSFIYFAFFIIFPLMLLDNEYENKKSNIKYSDICGNLKDESNYYNPR